jgi:hypothetical protein
MLAALPKNVREKMVATLRKILANFRKILTRKKLETLPKNVDEKCGLQS